MPRTLSQEARQKAIAAAQDLVAEGGIANFTVDGVARRSGVAKTTLYRHWRSGNELLVEALDCVIEHIETPDTGNLRDDLGQLFTHVIPMANDPTRRRMMLEMLGATAADPELAALKDALIAERTRPLHDVIERAVSRGEIAPIALDLAHLLIEGPVLAALVTGRPLTTETLDPLLDYVIRGLGRADPDPYAD